MYEEQEGSEKFEVKIYMKWILYMFCLTCVHSNRMRWYSKIFERLSQCSQMAQDAVLAFRRGKMLEVQIKLETYIFILNSSFSCHSSQLGEANTNKIKHDFHPE